MVIRASPKRAGDGKFFTVLPAKAEDEMGMVVAAIAMQDALHYRNQASCRRPKALGIGKIAVGVVYAEGCRRRSPSA
jgi:hypothetical protein